MSVVKFPASTNLSPEQAIDSAKQDADNLKQVLIIGFDDDERLYVRSSKMVNAKALWLLKVAELELLGFGN